MPAFPLSLIAILGVIGFSSDASAYYDRQAEGWFWYQQEPELIAEEQVEEEEKEEPSVIVMAPPPEQEVEEPKGPPALSAAWFRDNLQTYMDRAIDEPTPENIEAYFLLQRVMMDKAQSFADNSQRVVMGDPLLDESTRRSLDPATSAIQEQLSNKRRFETLDRVMSKAGIAYFFSGDCDLCAQQASIISNLAERSGLQVLPISIDGAPLQNGLYADTMVMNQGQAENLGIENGPAVFLMVPPSTWVPVTFAPTTQDDLVTRILMASVDAEVITEDEYNKTRAINVNRSLANAMNNVTEGNSLPEESSEIIKLLRSVENTNGY